MSTYAPILDMPNELLDHTFSYMDKSDIISMRSTHQVFQHAARRVLFRRLCLPMQRDENAQDFHHLQQCFELASKDETFSSHIRELQLEYTFGYVDKDRVRLRYKHSLEGLKTYLREISWIKNRTIQKLIASLPSLHTVTIYLKGNPRRRKLEQAFVRLLRVALHSCPVDIRLLCAEVYVWPTTEFTKISRVTSLAFDGPATRVFRGPPVRETEANHLAYLGLLQKAKNLDLGYNIIPSAETLGTIINYCPKLSSLTLWLQDSVSPAELARTLEPVRDTLRTLHVHREYACFSGSSTAQGFDSADFGSFEALRELHIGSSVMLRPLLCHMPPDATTGFIWYFDQSDRKAMYAHLPPHLDNLEIAFEWPNSLFAVGASYHAQFKELPESVKEKGFEWLQGLLEMGIPKVVLQEKEHGCTTWGRGSCGKLTKEMKLPKTVWEKCVEAGVRLEVWLLESGKHLKMVST